MSAVDTRGRGCCMLLDGRAPPLLTWGTVWHHQAGDAEPAAQQGWAQALPCCPCPWACQAGKSQLQPAGVKRCQVSQCRGLNRTANNALCLHPTSFFLAVLTHVVLQHLAADAGDCAVEAACLNDSSTGADLCCSHLKS